MKWQMAGWLSAGHERGLRFLGVEAIDAFVSAAGKGERLWRYLTISGAGSTGPAFPRPVQRPQLHL